MKIWQMTIAAVFFAVVFIAGCNGGGGSSGGSHIVLSGSVFNNHTDEDAGGREIVGATVILVSAGDVKTADSVSPVEDLAYGNPSYPKTATGSNGSYQFAIDDFSQIYPANESYYIFVVPPSGSDQFLPGGNASRTSLSLNDQSHIRQDIILTDSNGSDAGYIGTTVCLICHPDKNDIKHTLHFSGIRKIGPDGAVGNGLMDLTDTSVYNLPQNINNIMDKFTRPATQYQLADDPGKSVWLGKDDTGMYFQLTSDSNPRFYIRYSYGGETGLWRGLFITTVYAATGTYADRHGITGNDYAYYVMAPIQYNEDENSVNGGQFVTYHADRWDFDGTANNAFTADPETASFDLGCAVCHGAVGIKTVSYGQGKEFRVAVFPKDENGYEFGGTLSEMNVGCEKCHGPGSNHLAVGGRGYRIIAPDKLSAGRLTMICGSCHINSQNQTDIGGNSPIKSDGNGNYDIFLPGMTPAQFFGTSDQAGKDIVPFGTVEIGALTENGYLKPVDLETDPAASWMDKPFGAELNHSKASQQHYLDFVRSKKFKNPDEILTCISCHNAHGSSYRHMAVDNVDNNAVCLACHSGSNEIFPNIKAAMVNRLKNDHATSADISVIGNDVEAHIFDKTGTQQMGPYDPEGTAMGRCTLCHMSKTARSADWHNALETRLGQYRHGDISSHTFDVMSTEAVNAMGVVNGAEETTPAGITHECGTCHRFSGLN